VTAFNEQSFSRRFATMGDTCEAVFDLVYPKNHKLGLNRPPFFMGGMEPAMRYTPDRMLRDRFVECMGIGRDRKLKIKTDKIEALWKWATLGRMDLFIFDQHKNTYYEAELQDWATVLGTSGIARNFDNDGKAYIELHARDFPTLPQPVPEPEAAHDE